MIFAETTRLKLRPFSPTDLEPFLAYRNDPEVALYQGWNVPFTREKAIQFIEGLQTAEPGVPGEWYQIALELKETGEMIGDCAFQPRPSGIQAEVGFSIAREFHQQGFGSEAVGGLLHYLFQDLSMHRISAYCDTRNEGSWKLLQKVGFRLEGHYLENYWDGRNWASEYHYAILRREWESK